MIVSLNYFICLFFLCRSQEFGRLSKKAEMAAGCDVRDILELEADENNDFITKEALFNDSKKVLFNLIVLNTLLLYFDLYC